MKKIFLLITLAIISACSYSHTSGGDAAPPPSGFGNQNPEDGEPTVRFADVKTLVFDTSCTECHVRKGLDLSFIDYANSKQFTTEIFERVFVDGDMPPRNKLTTLQEQVLRAWLDAGSPE